MYSTRILETLKTPPPLRLPSSDSHWRRMVVVVVVRTHTCGLERCGPITNVTRSSKTFVLLQNVLYFTLYLLLQKRAIRFCAAPAPTD